jgi:L-rhamnose isomerase
MSDEVIEIMKEIVRAGATSRVYIGTDFFDASINRIGAWVIGARAVTKALLVALLEPAVAIKKYEDEGKLFARLGMLEDSKTMPFGAVWNYYCKISSTPHDKAWIDEVLKYESEVLDRR